MAPEVPPRPVVPKHPPPLPHDPQVARSAGWRARLRVGLPLAALGLGLLAWMNRPMSRPASSPDDERPRLAFPLIGLDGQPVPPGPSGLLVSFWASTCTICLQEWPALAALRQRWSAQGIEVVTVAMAGDNPEMIRHLWRMNRQGLPMVSDSDGRIAAALGPITGTPTRCLLDATGRPHHRETGALVPGRLDARLRAMRDDQRRPGITIPRSGPMNS